MEKAHQSRKFTIVGSVITFVLQVMLAPNIAILDVVPNLLLVFVVLNAMYSPKTRALVTGFILGLSYDFLSVGALGTMAFVLSVIGFSVNSLNKDMFTTNWVSQAFVLLIAAFFAELLHSVFLSILGFDSDFITSLIMRVLPGSLYDALFGLIVIAIMSRFSSFYKRRRMSLKGRFD